MKQLRILQAIADQGSFWGASDTLDCSASAVSQQLAGLEKLVGQRLVERSRGRRRVVLTDAGQLLLRHAEAIVARVSAAEADFVAFTQGTAGRLRVGTYQSVGTRILPRLVREFALEWPGVEVGLTEGLSDARMLAMIERGELDFTFTTMPLPSGPFNAIQLMRDPYVLVVPAGSELARRQGELAVQDLAGLPLIAIRNCQAEVEGHLRSMGADPKIGFQSNDNSIVQRLVASGVGVAIAPLLTVDESDQQIQLVRIRDFPPRLLALAWHRDRHLSAVASAFAKSVQTICARLQTRDHVLQA